MTDVTCRQPADPTLRGVGWRERASCTSEDPELFFPIGVGGPARYQATIAKRVCDHCPVRNECLQWALESRQDYGVWGGHTEEERRDLMRLVRGTLPQRSFPGSK